ncbi:hypothetical protein NDU88_005649 [Pleurodeles waltl]|uniref:Uncharacterized protein n=1 Tax=Pleurodeles waltl TaxID=8319 RepID=A0AAV7TB79_PLEWA|nr:hypothetical protein NDU88_005649 [Pleurodeles waltl]
MDENNSINDSSVYEDDASNIDTSDHSGVDDNHYQNNDNHLFVVNEVNDDDNAVMDETVFGNENLDGKSINTVLLSQSTKISSGLMLSMTLLVAPSTTGKETVLE